ncbi:MAG: HEAT repeat domain-containing protein [Phycisphaerales bacterium]
MTIHHSRRPSRTLSLAALLAALVLSLPSVAVGQSLPPEVTTAASITPDQAKKVQEFVAAQVGRLKGTDAAAREAARDALMSPLDGQGVTLAFRLEYAKAITPELERLASASEDHTAFNALRVAGKLGTPRGVDILRTALNDKRPAVRAGAARSLRETIRAAVSAAQTPINQNKLEEAVESLGKALNAEADPIVAKAMVTALDAPRSGVPSGPAGALHAKAMERLAEALSARLKAAPNGDAAAMWAEATVAGVDAVRRTFIDPQRSSFTTQAGLKKQSATLCGHAIAMVKARMFAGVKPDATEAAALRSIANASETTLLLIEGADRTQRLAAAMDAGDPGAFGAAADEWLKRLEGPPFGLDGKQFKKN